MHCTQRRRSEGVPRARLSHCAVTTAVRRPEAAAAASRAQRRHFPFRHARVPEGRGELIGELRGAACACYRARRRIPPANLIRAVAPVTTGADVAKRRSVTLRPRAPATTNGRAAMRAALAGDEAAYRRLLEEIGRAVRAMARGAFSRARVGDADIEDVVQETLLAIHLKRPPGTAAPARPLGQRHRAPQDRRRACGGAACAGPSRSRISRPCSPRRKAKTRICAATSSG